MMEQSQQDIAKRLTQFYIEEMGLQAEDFDNQTLLFSDGHLDSMDLIRIVAFIESEFQMKVPTFEVSLESFDTVEKISQFIHQKKTQ